VPFTPFDLGDAALLDFELLDGKAATIRQEG
jgi:hypothetical protein